MSEAQNLGTITPDEREKRVQAAIHAQIDARVAQAEAKMLEGIAETIGRYELPNREGIQFLDKQGNSVLRTQSPTMPLYRRMSEEEREIRNPDSDHWMSEWLRGIHDKNFNQTMQADGKLREMFPDMYRADTLEGAAGASGAFGAGSGGTLLPRPLEALVSINRDRTAKAWRYVSTYQMSTQTHNIPTGAAMTAFMQDETTTPTTTGATFSQVQITAYPGIAKAIVGKDMLRDSAVNLISWFGQRGGFALGVLEDNEIFKEGTGSAPHITKLAGTAYAETTTNALAYADVLAMFFGVQQEYRANARWFIASNVLLLMSNVRDGNNRPFYGNLLDPPKVLSDTPTGAPDIGSVGTLLGRPVHDVPLTNGEIWFGDPAAAYALGRRQGIEVEVSEHFLFDTRRTMLLLTQRFAGNNLDTTNSTRHAAGITSATI